MLTKVALIVSGGVSLGSFEAGALSEVLYQLDRLNRETRAQRFVIDVISGGSAGSLSAAVTARVLMNGYDAITRRALHRIWVQEADIDRMIGGELDGSGLLSTHLQEELAQRYLVGAGDAHFSGYPGEPSSLAPAALKLWFSLSNLVGVTYEYPPRGAVRLPTTLFVDHFETTIERGRVPDWERVARAALASGSHPAMFAPQSLQRHRADYPPELDSSDNPAFDTAGTADMGYYDGGVFNNEPLGPALQLAKHLDGGVLDRDRRFILIDPSHNLPRDDPAFARAGAMGRSLWRLGEMIATQAGSKIWMLEQAGEIERRSASADGVTDLIGRLFAQLRSSHELEAVTETLREIADSGVSSSAVERVCAELQPEYGDAALHDEERSLLEALVRAFWDRTNVGRRRVRLGSITASAEVVAGDRLGGFLGFFDERWRQHDYAIGRERARVCLPAILGLPDEEFPREPGSGGSRRGYFQYRPAPQGHVRAVDVSDKDKVRRFMAHLDTALRAALRREPPGLRAPVSWLVRRVVRCALALQFGTAGPVCRLLARLVVRPAPD